MFLSTLVTFIIPLIIPLLAKFFFLVVVVVVVVVVFSHFYFLTLVIFMLKIIYKRGNYGIGRTIFKKKKSFFIIFTI